MADGNMANFLATDKVPDTIFGIPIVSRREDYTEEDIAFFKEHPEAGGYYSMGDEETEPESQGAVGGGVAFASIFGPEGLKNLIKAGWKNLPSLVDTPFEAGGKTFQIGELKDVTMRKGWETALMRKSKTLADLLDFSSPQGKRLLAAYPGIDRTVVKNESRPDKPGQKKSYKDVSGTFVRGENGAPDVIWLNPDHADYRQKSSAYNTVLHEGINHAVWAREPSFPRRVIPYGDLSNFGYATDLEEAIVDLASNRGEARASSGKGAADPAALASGVVPHIVARVASASDDDGSVSQRQPDSRMLKKGAK